FIQHGTHDHDDTPGFWDRVAVVVMKRPVISVVVAAGLLVTAAIPYTGIELGVAGVSTLPDSFESKKGFLILEEQFAGGDVYPAEVVIDGQVNSSGVQQAIEDLKRTVATDAAFGPSEFEANSAGDLGVVSFQMALDPNSQEAVHAIERL